MNTKAKGPALASAMVAAGAFAFADAAQAAPQVVSPSAAAAQGVALSPEEMQAGADVLVQAPPGRTLSGTVIPKGCVVLDTCAYEFKSDGVLSRGATTASAARKLRAVAAQVADGMVVPVNGAVVKDLTVTSSASTRAYAPESYGWMNDTQCGYSCSMWVPGAWKHESHLIAWFDGDFAWSERQRRSRVGDHLCDGRNGTGISVSPTDQSIHGEGSPGVNLYLNCQDNISGFVKGGPINKDHAIHRWQNGDSRSWVVFL